MKKLSSAIAVVAGLSSASAAAQVTGDLDVAACAETYYMSDKWPSMSRAARESFNQGLVKWPFLAKFKYYNDEIEKRKMAENILVRMDDRQFLAQMRKCNQADIITVVKEPPKSRDFPQSPLGHVAACNNSFGALRLEFSNGSREQKNIDTAMKPLSNIQAAIMFSNQADSLILNEASEFSNKRSAAGMTKRDVDYCTKYYNNTKITLD